MVNSVRINNFFKFLSHIKIKKNKNTVYNFQICEVELEFTEVVSRGTVKKHPNKISFVRTVIYKSGCNNNIFTFLEDKDRLFSQFWTKCFQEEKLRFIWE